MCLNLHPGILSQNWFTHLHAMKKAFTLFLFLSAFQFCKAQVYFPPAAPGNWDTLSPTRFGWCQAEIDSLYSMLQTENTKAFILLKDGKIVLERYFDGHTASSNWYWASAAKSLTATLVGIAKANGNLQLSDSSSKYLGVGWTSATSAQEGAITVWHQLSMTSGLNDGLADPFCTIDTCLQYLAPAGSRWAYHNAPYTLLDGVISGATGQTLNQFTNQRIKQPTGMDGLFIPSGFNNTFYSTARSMARFGWLIYNRGWWNGQAVLNDSVYFNQMVNTSQPHNLSYGYLWWLNGKASYKLPGSQLNIPGFMNPDAPADMIAAMGKNGQFINVVPSQGMVWIRMGDAPDNSPVPFLLQNKIWQYINQLPCGQSSSVIEPTMSKWNLYPQPANDVVYLQNATQNQNINVPIAFVLSDMQGRKLRAGSIDAGQWPLRIETGDLPTGAYLLQIQQTGQAPQGIRLLVVH